MTTPSEETIRTGGIDLVVVKGGAGKPLLILHDELGYPGWMAWNERLAEQRTMVIPLQPGFGRTPRLDWISNYRDLAGFYARMLREQRLAPIDVIGFSAGAYLAAEMVAADPKVFGRMVLVGPMGVKPTEGEILDFLSMTMRSHLRATVADPVNTEEFAKIYGGEMTPEQFERFEDARTETSRLGWDPFMYNPSLPHLLEGIEVPTLLVRGSKDGVVPHGCLKGYAVALAKAEIATIDGVGHRPEIENGPEFVRLVKNFLR
ncbi:MAG TPA: alpha/beta hydrolase [Candidatus Binataceae bacterium]|nr:alpha/beta hydrolase [Candidatus Binataceae bacterium]